jgi:hypothetical protein
MNSLLLGRMSWFVLDALVIVCRNARGVVSRIGPELMRT